ncbi:MAG: NAD/NADP octopine/nopaline dehydrogenase family protein [Paludibacteraceae bacterium]|nr:NAD/NADP octopine/nopaline dehydrogenase family protein [Paludibacteraceae bacterium]
MKITIIGCGNSGLIHAAKLLEKGMEVCLYKSSTYNSTFFEKIQQEGQYNVLDETNNGHTFSVEPTFITTNPKEAMDFADVVMVMTTTKQQEDVAKQIAPYVHDGQIIALIPGYMGSLIFKKYIRKDVIYSEWETTAYNGRVMNNEYVRITFYNPRNAISTLPVSEGKRVLDIFSQCFDNTRYLRKHILESALHNPNMIVHPIGTLFSASRIEYSKGEFYMYKEAFTPSVIRVIQAFDTEKNKILNAFGCESLDYFEAAKWRNTEDLSIPAMDVFRSFAESSNKGPLSLNGRYFTEDIPNGLGLFVSIGKIVGVDTCIPEGIMSLSSALLGRDLTLEARTIQKLLDKNTISIKDITNNII